GWRAGMDKALFKAPRRDSGIPTPGSVAVEPSDAGSARERVAAAGLAPPLFVKPSNGGSSVGVTKVKRMEDLDAALAAALQYDERALVEEGIDGRELEGAGLGDDSPEAAIPGE